MSNVTCRHVNSEHFSIDAFHRLTEASREIRFTFVFPFCADAEARARRKTMLLLPLSSSGCSLRREIGSAIFGWLWHYDGQHQLFRRGCCRRASPVSVAVQGIRLWNALPAALDGMGLTLTSGTVENMMWKLINEISESSSCALKPGGLPELLPV